MQSKKNSSSLTEKNAELNQLDYDPNQTYYLEDPFEVSPSTSSLTKMEKVDAYSLILDQLYYRINMIYAEKMSKGDLSMADKLLEEMRQLLVKASVLKNHPALHFEKTSHNNLSKTMTDNHGDENLIPVDRIIDSIPFRLKIGRSLFAFYSRYPHIYKIFKDIQFHLINPFGAVFGLELIDDFSDQYIPFSDQVYEALNVSENLSLSDKEGISVMPFATVSTIARMTQTYRTIMKSALSNVIIRQFSNLVILYFLPHDITPDKLTEVNEAIEFFINAFMILSQLQDEERSPLHLK